MENKCLNCGSEIHVAIFKGSGHCSERCRKILAGEIPCAYEVKWTDEVGDIEVCVIHGQNSKYAKEEGPNRPCLAIEPWLKDDADFGPEEEEEH